MPQVQCLPPHSLRSNVAQVHLYSQLLVLLLRISSSKGGDATSIARRVKEASLCALLMGGIRLLISEMRLLMSEM